MRNPRTQAWLVALVVLLPACAERPPIDGRTAAPREPRVPGLQLAESIAGLDSASASLVVDFEKTRDVCVRAWLPEVATTVRTRLIVRDPHGAEFFESNQMFTTDAARTSIPSGAMGRPLYLHPARVRDGGWILDQCFAVGGSIFQRIAHRDDAWGVELSVDGRPGALAATLFHRSKR
jgi:hypothetical protein